MKTSSNKKSGYNLLSSFILLFFIFFISIGFSNEINSFVKIGLKLCFSSVIGAVFPFLILTDLLTSVSSFEKIKPLRIVFEKLFKINGYGISAFIVGVSCGFPLGVKVSCDLYQRGVLSLDEYERLIGFSNNTGPAFIICGIGYGMRGSLYDGIILYISMVLSAIIVGIIIGVGKQKSIHSYTPELNRFDLVSSVKNSAVNTLHICSFVTLFSVLSGFLMKIVGDNIFFYISIPFIEIGNAAKALAKTSIITKKASLILTSFAISFSGLSVHLQAKSFITDKSIKILRYFISKLMQGTISMLITLLITLL